MEPKILITPLLLYVLPIHQVKCTKFRIENIIEILKELSNSAEKIISQHIILLK